MPKSNIVRVGRISVQFIIPVTFNILGATSSLGLSDLSYPLPKMFQRSQYYSRVENSPDRQIKVNLHNIHYVQANVRGKN